MKNSKMFLMFLFIMVGMVAFQAPSVAMARSDTATAILGLKAQLSQGAAGDDVKILQAFLASDTSIYPEGLITGYFGSLTKAAVARFQKKHDIPPVGRVGPKTLAKISADLQGDNQLATEEDDSGKKTVCAIVPPGHLIAPGYLRKMGAAPVVPECQVLPPGIAAKLGDTTSQNNGNSEDKFGPVISDVKVNSITLTSATISWKTNEKATSEIVYGTTSSYGTSVSDPALVTIHQKTITGLVMGDTYHYKITSKDAAGNSTSTKDAKFTTSSDVTAPVISLIASTDLTANSVKITWATDEDTTSKVYYSTTTPVDTATALSVSSADLATAHTMSISSLTANTTYYYKIEAKDANMNTTTSTSEGSFTTLAI